MSLFSLVNMFSGCIYAVACIIQLKCKYARGATQVACKIEPPHHRVLPMVYGEWSGLKPFASEAVVTSKVLFPLR